LYDSPPPPAELPELPPQAVKDAARTPAAAMDPNVLRVNVELKFRRIGLPFIPAALPVRRLGSSVDMIRITLVDSIKTNERSYVNAA
jgi:hypothetical protein